MTVTRFSVSLTVLRSFDQPTSTRDVLEWAADYFCQSTVFSQLSRPFHACHGCLYKLQYPYQPWGKKRYPWWMTNLINGLQIHNVDEKKNCMGVCQFLNFSGKNDTLPNSTFSSCRILDFVLPNSGKSTCQKQFNCSLTDYVPRERR